MDFGGPDFVLSIIAMSFIAWVVTTAIRAKHGYPVENEWGGIITKDGGAELKRQNEILKRDNEALRGKLGRVEERVAVLERIATEAPSRLAAQIEDLRG
jgi:hypothetical protein